MRDEASLTLAGAKDYDERRRDPRVRVQYPVSLRMISAPNLQPFTRRTIHCMTSDVSVSGTRLAILTDHVIPLGAELKLSVKTGRFGKAYQHQGIVRWVVREPTTTAFVIGVEFTETQPPRLKAWLKHLSRFRSDD